MAKNTSRSNICACKTKSALDRNLNASANSKKPKTTFTELSQPPDLGKEFINPGNKANKANGIAIANENPSIPKMGARPPSDAACTNKVPTMGPVQLKLTMAKAKAIKKIPIIPPRSALRSTALAQELGNIISKAPKNEIAKTTRSKRISS